MKKTILTVAILLTTGICARVAAQVTPPGAGDRDLRDTNVKGRSNELERVNRQMKKDAAKKKKENKTEVVTPPPAPTEDRLAAVYPEIQEDYEGMQKSQGSMMDAYADGKNVDFEQLAALAAAVNRHAQRLSFNLFPPPAENTDAARDEKKDRKKDADSAAKNLRVLLVELDESVAAVISSSMFQNLRAVEPLVSEKAQNDLKNIVRLSDSVAAEAGKQTKK